jgi:hypothetical protein
MAAGTGAGKDALKLGAVALVSAVFLLCSALFQTITGRREIDGILGVVLGLYVCSIPARHFLNLLLYWRMERIRFSSKRFRGLWVALNILAMIGGWLVIVVGATRFTSGGR